MTLAGVQRWQGERLGCAARSSTGRSKCWVIATGRALAFAEHPWLDGPGGSPQGSGEQWIDEHAARAGLHVAEEPNGGLVPDMGVLDEPGFAARRLRPEVRGFRHS